jgi:uncharacterized protein
MPANNEQRDSDRIPGCRNCGACCFSDDPRYVRVSGDDYERMGELVETFTRFIENRCFMRIERGHCAALRVEPGLGGFCCELYEVRPQICRDLERRSPQCLAELYRKADRARTALARRSRTRGEKSKMMR